MIEANKMIQKMGKENFVNFVLNNKDKEKTAAERSHQNRFGKRIKSRMCEHGVWIIDNYEPKPCGKCHTVSDDAPGVIMHTHEYFNVGTGTYGTTSEHRKYAKAHGLVEAG